MNNFIQLQGEFRWAINSAGNYTILPGKQGWHSHACQRSLVHRSLVNLQRIDGNLQAVHYLARNKHLKRSNGIAKNWAKILFRRDSKNSL